MPSRVGGLSRKGSTTAHTLEEENNAQASRGRDIADARTCTGGNPFRKRPRASDGDDDGKVEVEGKREGGRCYSLSTSTTTKTARRRRREKSLSPADTASAVECSASPEAIDPSLVAPHRSLGTLVGSLYLPVVIINSPDKSGQFKLFDTLFKEVLRRIHPPMLDFMAGGRQRWTTYEEAAAAISEDGDARVRDHLVGVDLVRSSYSFLINSTEPDRPDMYHVFLRLCAEVMLLTVATLIAVANSCPAGPLLLRLRPLLSEFPFPRHSGEPKPTEAACVAFWDTLFTRGLAGDF